MNLQPQSAGPSPEGYPGFEQGPIRPPSEAYSLLVRVTRNCPWNHCTFCPIYKGKRFSLRPAAHVKHDIDMVYKFVEILKSLADDSGRISRSRMSEVAEQTDHTEMPAFQAAIHWFSGGMRSIFIQDANSLIIKPADLVDILTHLKKRFYWVERITSYARSHTIARISDENLTAIRDAGLDRIHIGLESGSDQVLKAVRKGTTKEQHIKAGIKVKKAGMELSEYVIPGLGGKALSEIHATETADALNRINADFIRLRTLAIPGGIPLYDDWASGKFQKPTDLEMVEEILLLIELLEGVTSVIKSDHVLNLFQEVEGKLPQDKDRMIQVLRTFLSMPPERQCAYQVGRRAGFFSSLSDLENPKRLARAERVCKEHGITPDNVDDTIDELMKRFI
jgi:histone acetyltransferase (RNA polymerase elongator complex component)